MSQKIQTDKIILASASPRRSELLSRNSIPFETAFPDAEESSDSSVPPQELVCCNARLKARSVAKKKPNRIVLGADTIVVLDSKIYGKPRDLNDARAILKTLCGKTHKVFTGLALVVFEPESENFLEKTSFCETSVSFKNLDSSGIENYLSKVDVLDKAGAYAAQEFGSMIIEKIDGPFDNVMGLPCELLKGELEKFIAHRL